MNNKNSVPVFSIILINHNNTRHTIPCLKHLIIQSFQNFEVIVIENGSNTDQIKELEEYIININNSHENGGKIKFFKMGRDLGFTGGNNYGIKKSAGKYIYILNNDTLFPSNMLLLIFNFLKTHPKVDILTPKILYYSNKKKIWALGGMFDFKNPLITKINYTGEPDRQFPPLLRVNMVTGCAFVIKKETLRKVGLFDDNYFMYWEDADFSYRANKIGLKMVVDTRIVVYHNVTERQKVFSRFVIGYLFRNRMYFILKNASYSQIFIQLLLTPMYFAIHLVNFKYRRFDGKIIFKLKNLINGLCLGLKSRFF